MFIKYDCLFIAYVDEQIQVYYQEQCTSRSSEF